MSISDNISRTAGFAVGGIFVAAFGGPWAISLDSAPFFISFLLVIFAGHFPSPLNKTQSQKKFKEDLFTGLRYIWQDGFAKSVMILSPTLIPFFMCSLMLTQVMAIQVWNANPFQFGLFEACIPLGYRRGASIIVILDNRLKNRGKLVMINLLSMGPLYILLSLVSSSVVAWNAASSV